MRRSISSIDYDAKAQALIESSIARRKNYRALSAAVQAAQPSLWNRFLNWLAGN